MSFESSAKDAVALWPMLPECSQADVLLWPGRQKDLMPLVFPILGTPVQFRVKEVAATELPPLSDMSLSLGGHGGRLHISGQWLNELCNKVGLSGIDKGDWSCTNGHQQEFLLRWLLDGMLNQLQTQLDCGPPIDISADCPGSAEGLRYALFAHEGISEQPSVWLDLPRAMADLLPREALDHPHAFWRRVPLVASLRAGSQTLRLYQLSSLACGDIVLLRKPLEDLQLVLSSFQQADVRVDDKGYVITNSWYLDERREVCVDSVNRQDDAGEDAVLDDLTIELVCEVGRVSMTLAELKSLKVGSVLPMKRRAQQAVDLIVNGAKIGQGELVRLDDTLGVRVTRLVNSHG